MKECPENPVAKSFLDDIPKIGPIYQKFDEILRLKDSEMNRILSFLVLTLTRVGQIFETTSGVKSG